VETTPRRVLANGEHAYLQDEAHDVSVMPRQPYNPYNNAHHTRDGQSPQRVLQTENTRTVESEPTASRNTSTLTQPTDNPCSPDDETNHSMVTSIRPTNSTGKAMEVGREEATIQSRRDGMTSWMKNERRMVLSDREYTMEMPGGTMKDVQGPEK